MSRLSEILSLPDGEKAARGLQHTRKEIAQQPETWGSTFARVQKNRSDIQTFLRSAGVFGDSDQTSHSFFGRCGYL